jgi:hypothetical protein
MLNRERTTRSFLLLAALVAGPLAGAILFDLMVLAGAWSADPPTSLSLLPYGERWPVDTGMFFGPFSALLLIAAFGALAAGWRTPWRYRWLLCVPSIGVLALLVLTVLVFWPMDLMLWWHAIGSPNDKLTDIEAAEMAKNWVRLDWVRFAGGVAGFIAALRALTMPWPAETAPKDGMFVRVTLTVAMAGVAWFVYYFVSNIRPV